MPLATIRADFPSLATCTHFNTGGMAPLPQPVIAEWLRLPQYVAAHGPARMQAHDEDVTRADWSHRTLAALLGITADEIAFTTQFSTAVNIVLEGLPWQPGDAMIVTDQEHPAFLTPALNIARRYGVTIHRLPVSENADAMLAGLATLLGPRTRLVAMSHVTTETGTRLPVEAITRMAHENGSLVLFDGAQSVGQFPVDLRALGCDFYAMVGYKWLLGPYPSAALFVRPEALDRIEVTWTGSRVTERAGIDMEEVTFIGGAGRFEYGGRVFAHDSAMAVGADYVRNLGPENIEAHAQQLSGALHAALAEVPGARIRSTRDLPATTGIVTFSVDGMDGTTLSTALRERWGILTRPALRNTSVRASIAAFTNARDLGLLVDGVAACAAGR